MRRYWIPKDQIREAAGSITVNFSGDIFHHIFGVCRQEVGSKFEVLAGDQKAHFVEVIQVGKKSAEARVLETRTIPSLKTPHIHLAISVPRFPVMEAVIEKAVEMGVVAIHPFFSEYSFVRSAAMVPESKIERWQKIVVSATQQSGRGELLNISPALSWTDLQNKFNQTPNKMGLFAYEGEGQKSIKNYLQSRQTQKPQEIWLFVGSEGGFSQTEVQAFHEMGLEAVTLGEQVLRVETACIALVSVLKYEFDLMG